MADETLWVVARLHSTTLGTYAESDMVLGDGVDYVVVVDGNHSVWNNSLLNGDPQPIRHVDITDNAGVASHDAEVQFAAEGSPAGLPTHRTDFMFDRGAGFEHIEPVGGPFSAWQPDHTYVYVITGMGVPLRAAITDTPITDNSGRYRVVIRGHGWLVGSIRVA